jgi:tetratricopeptide (TPR) repeat protein
MDAHLLAGNIYANMCLYDKALKKCVDAIEINDLSADAYLLLGSIYYKIGEKEKAISSFKKAIYLDNNSILSHYYLGNLYKDANLIVQAIKEYKNVIHIFETSSENKERLVGEVFTVKQLKEICVRNIEILAIKER